MVADTAARLPRERQHPQQRELSRRRYCRGCRTPRASAIANSNVPNMVGQISTCLAGARHQHRGPAQQVPRRVCLHAHRRRRRRSARSCWADPRHRWRALGADRLTAMVARKQKAATRAPRRARAVRTSPSPLPTPPSAANAANAAYRARGRARAASMRSMSRFTGCSTSGRGSRSRSASPRRRRPHGGLLPPGARGAGAAPGARAQRRAVAR